jgi:hypothetical protein
MKEFIQSENIRQDSGIMISFVRFTKPLLPNEIETNYLALAEERTMKKVVIERQARLTSEKESEIIMAQKDNDIKRQNAANENNIRIMNAKSEQEQELINNQIIINRAKAEKEKIELEAKGLAEMFKIPGYQEFMVANSTSQNLKIYYGEKLPQYVGYLSSSPTV